MAMLLFVCLNGVRLAPDQAQATFALLRLAASVIAEDGLARSIRENCPV